MTLYCKYIETYMVNIIMSILLKHYFQFQNSLSYNYEASIDNDDCINVISKPILDHITYKYFLQTVSVDGITNEHITLKDLFEKTVAGINKG